jgi:hypothetical protein
MRSQGLMPAIDPEARPSVNDWKCPAGMGGMIFSE